MSSVVSSPVLRFMKSIALLFALTGNIAIGEEDPGLMLDRAAFESWVFLHDDSLAEGVRRLESEIDVTLSSIKLIAELSILEEEHLKLAGKGDIKRFVDMIYQTYVPISGKELQDDSFNEAWEKTLPLQKKLNSGLFEEGSLFNKVLMRFLSEEEKKAWLSLKTERLKREKAIYVDAFIIDLERSAPLLRIQREKLRELLLDKVPNIRYPQEDGIYIVQYYFSKIDKQVCGELFDSEQLKLLSNIRNQGQEMGQWLVDDGVLMEEPSK